MSILSCEIRAKVSPATVALALLLLPMVLGAVSPRKSDYVNLGANAGFSTLIGKYSGMNVYGGFTGGLHLGYEYRDGNLWISTTGDMQYLSSNCQSDIQIDRVYFQDTRLTNAVMNYEMMSRLRERQNFGIIGISIMAGYNGGTYRKGGFYVGAGISVGCKFDINNTVSQKYRTYATYDEYIDPYHDMPEYFYSNYDAKDTASFGTKLNIAVLGEIGWDFKMNRCDKVKVGFFMEAGLTNIMRDVPVHESIVNPENVSVIMLYSAYNRKEMADKIVMPVIAGVKLSLLFNVSRITDKCRTCPCYRKR
ncbi:MAG: hypothetical protein KBT41_00400 [bacterium]|nr:hypothetical protein [Candidatus Colousia faecequi]